MLGILPLALHVDHEIQIALLDPTDQVALIVKNIGHHVQLCTKRFAHSLMNGRVGSIWLLQLPKKRPLVDLVSFVTDYSASDLLGQIIIDTVLCNHRRQLRQDGV
jgi:hypothetical protein